MFSVEFRLSSLLVAGSLKAGTFLQGVSVAGGQQIIEPVVVVAMLVIAFCDALSAIRPFLLKHSSGEMIVELAGHKVNADVRCCVEDCYSEFCAELMVVPSWLRIEHHFEIKSIRGTSLHHCLGVTWSD